MTEEVEYLEMRDDSTIVTKIYNTGRRESFIWCFCAKNGCKNRTYHNSIFCYPHTRDRLLEATLNAAKSGKREPTVNQVDAVIASNPISTCSSAG